MKGKPIVFVIPTAIRKADVTLELCEYLVENAKIVEPQFLFEITLFNDAFEGGVVIDKTITTTFQDLAKSDPQELYDDMIINELKGMAPSREPLKVLDANEYFNNTQK